MAWQANWKKRQGNLVWARNADSVRSECRQWHWVESSKPCVRASRPPIRTDTWEVNLLRKAPTAKRWARNPNSRQLSARRWQPQTVANLRRRGVPFPKHENRWEFDWSKRKLENRQRYVWGRNPGSNHPHVHEWTWVASTTVYWLGIPWQKVPVRRFRIHGGYILLNRGALTESERKLAKKYGLLKGYGYSVAEHRLVAAFKYKRNLAGVVVRHRNGIKTDNRPSNLLIGSYADNNRDHDTARLQAIAWRQRYIALREKVRASVAPTADLSSASATDR